MIVLFAIAGVGAAIIALATILAYLYARKRTIWLDPTRGRLLPYRCTTCDGCGVLWLDPEDSTWKIIPRKLRIFDSTRAMWHYDDATGRPALNTNSPLANTKKCPSCNGMFHHWDYPRWLGPQ